MNKRMTSRRGIALILVVAVLGIAAIMSYAMLSSSALQAQVGGTSKELVSADSLAESGVSYALYYLQHPELAPSLSNGHYPGETGVSVDGDSSGTFDVTVSDKDKDGSTSLPTNTYLIKSVGKAADVARTVYAKVYVTTKYRVVSALSVNNDMSIPVLVTVNIYDDTISGFVRKATDPLVRADGTLNIGLLNSLVGTVATLLTNITSSPMALPKYPAQAAPTLTGSNQINTLKSYTTYKWKGVTYTADQLTWDPYNETLATGNSATNPLNVWYTTSDRNLKGNVNLNGTLIVANGRTLKVSGVTTITAKPDPATGHAAMPALVVDKDISFEGLSRTLNVNGLMWVSNQIRGNTLTGLNWKLNVNGALMLPGAPAVAGTQVSSLLTGAMNLKYVQANVDLPDLSDKDQIPQNVKMLSWTNQ
jgi:Tfp pilus assembly protein PilX